VRGMEDLLRQDGVALMIEVTQNRAEVYQLLREHGYDLFNDAREPIENLSMTHDENLFCFKTSDPRIKNFARASRSASRS
jgi:hypothetical protein